MKECPGCKRTLPIESYGSRMKNGKRTTYSRCVPCTKAYNAEYRQSHKEEWKRYRNRYRATLGGQINKYTESAQTRGISFDLTTAQCKELMTVRECHYCNQELNEHGLQLDRVDSTAGYNMGNVVRCCCTCNMAKGSLTKEAYIQMCLNVAANNN